MTLERLILKDVFAYRGLVDLDVSGIGPIVAITGDNGQGKTSLIEVVPAVCYQKLPARENDHPKGYATSREARLEHWFSIEGRGRFRAVLQMDQGSDGVDGLLEQLLPDGTRVPLNDGKVSTLKGAIADLFPSFDLFINSCFAAQGRGDEFMRTPSTKMKDIFAGFLGLSTLLEMARTATDAAGLASATRDRLMMLRDELARDTSARVDEALSEGAVSNQAAIAESSTRKVSVEGQIVDVDAQLATMQDAVAAHGAATLRVHRASRELADRRQELSALDIQGGRAGATLLVDLSKANAYFTERTQALTDQQARVERTRDTETAVAGAATRDKVADLEQKVAGNRSVQDRRAQIDAAVVAVAEMSARLIDLRARREAARTSQEQASHALRGAEQQLAALAPIEHRHTRAQTDAGLLDSVPCHGAGDYAGCQLLQNAQSAKAEIEALAAQLLPKAALADDVGRRTREVETQRAVIDETKAAIDTDEAALVRHGALTQYAAALATSDERIGELQDLIAQAEADGRTAVTAAQDRFAAATADLDTQRAVAAREQETAVERAQRRHDEFLADLDSRRTVLNAAIAAADVERAAAAADLHAVGVSHTAAHDLQTRLLVLRDELEHLVTQIATAASRLADLEQRRRDLERRRARLADVTQRLALVEQSLIEWRDLAKSLGKGGLTDLEIDAAGPAISATANALLAHCLSGRFSLELVTQVAKKDGDMKDEFTVRVMDNELAPGHWRELRKLSGGQKTIVQEALMCAIALYVNDHAATPMRTLWRDETGAALSAQSAVHYVEMLRAVRVIGRLDKIFFITHNAEAAALADAQIVVADGTARIVLPPYGRTQEAA